MKALTTYTNLIEEELKSVDLPGSPAELYDPLRYFLTLGGKRIRPILTLLSAELFGATKKSVLPQALAIEVFHNFTLIHDDIMDDAPVRRNQPTVHEKWGSNIAILSGDVLLIKAYQLLGTIHPNHLPAAFNLFNTTAIEVCEGQQMDMNFESRNDVSAAEYIEMIRLKTSVLLGAALKMGALVSGASEKDQEHIYNFGQNIGIAFQIQDDILDLYADPEKFGKQVGGDVIANKKTLLYITALTKANAEQRGMMKRLEAEENLELKVSRTRELFDHLNAQEECKTRMEFYQNNAMKALDAVSTDPQSKKALIGLAEYLLNREV